MHELFANTGVQLLCFPLKSGNQVDPKDNDWQFCKCQVRDKEVRDYGFIQWFIQDRKKLFLAVDTTCGDPEEGHFSSEGSLTKDLTFTLPKLIGRSGKVYDVGKCEFRIRAAGAG